MRRKNVLRIAVGIVFPAAVMFVLFWALYIKRPLPCILYVTTGLYCPSCGATRAIIFLAHGDIINALKCNAMITVTILPLLFTVTEIWIDAVFCRNKQFVLSKKAIIIFCVFAAIYILFGAVRNIPAEPFIRLNPIK